MAKGTKHKVIIGLRDELKKIDAEIDAAQKQNKTEEINKLTLKKNQAIADKLRKNKQQGTNANTTNTIPDDSPITDAEAVELIKNEIKAAASEEINKNEPGDENNEYNVNDYQSAAEYLNGYVNTTEKNIKQANKKKQEADLAAQQEKIKTESIIQLLTQININAEKLLEEIAAEKDEIKKAQLINHASNKTTQLIEERLQAVKDQNAIASEQPLTTAENAVKMAHDVVDAAKADVEKAEKKHTEATIQLNEIRKNKLLTEAIIQQIKNEIKTKETVIADAHQNLREQNKDQKLYKAHKSMEKAKNELIDAIIGLDLPAYEDLKKALSNVNNDLEAAQAELKEAQAELNAAQAELKEARNEKLPQFLLNSLEQKVADSKDTLKKLKEVHSLKNKAIQTARDAYFKAALDAINSGQLGDAIEIKKEALAKELNDNSVALSNAQIDYDKEKSNIEPQIAASKKDPLMQATLQRDLKLAEDKLATAKKKYEKAEADNTAFLRTVGDLSLTIQKAKTDYDQSIKSKDDYLAVNKTFKEEITQAKRELEESSEDLKNSEINDDEAKNALANAEWEFISSQSEFEEAISAHKKLNDALVILEAHAEDLNREEKQQDTKDTKQPQKKRDHKKITFEGMTWEEITLSMGEGATNLLWQGAQDLYDVCQEINHAAKLAELKELEFQSKSPGEQYDQLIQEYANKKTLNGAELESIRAWNESKATLGVKGAYHLRRDHLLEIYGTDESKATLNMENKFRSKMMPAPQSKENLNTLSSVQRFQRAMENSYGIMGVSAKTTPTDQAQRNVLKKWFSDRRAPEVKYAELMHDWSKNGVPGHPGNKKLLDEWKQSNSKSVRDMSPPASTKTFPGSSGTNNVTAENHANTNMSAPNHKKKETELLPPPRAGGG